MLDTLIEVWSPTEARRRGGLSDASALVKLLFEDWLPHDHNCVAGSPSVTSGAATTMVTAHSNSASPSMRAFLGSRAASPTAGSYAPRWALASQGRDLPNRKLPVPDPRRPPPPYFSFDARRGDAANACRVGAERARQCQSPAGPGLFAAARCDETYGVRGDTARRPRRAAVERAWTRPW